jgi:hypothetical protein
MSRIAAQATLAIHARRLAVLITSRSIDLPLWFQMRGAPAPEWTETLLEGAISEMTRALRSTIDHGFHVEALEVEAAQERAAAIRTRQGLRTRERAERPLSR